MERRYGADRNHFITLEDEYEKRTAFSAYYKDWPRHPEQKGISFWIFLLFSSVLFCLRQFSSELLSHFLSGFLLSVHGRAMYTLWSFRSSPFQPSKEQLFCPALSGSMGNTAAGAFSPPGRFFPAVFQCRRSCRITGQCCLWSAPLSRIPGYSKG